MDLLDVFTGARALISDPARWTKNTFARDKDGLPVLATNPEADCFCVIGACRHVLNNSHDPLPEVVAVLRLNLPPSASSVAYFNDSTYTTHADILALLDRSIKSCPVDAGGPVL